jgi:putative SOS response-associated peptidase YedK
MRWGLVPSWADDVSIGNRLLNARSDGVATKPSFRSAFKRRRCLIIADGFYEWKATAAKTKQPYHMHRPDDRPFAFAGFWERWEKDEAPVESCTIITTDANTFIQQLHNRMPVILGADDYAKWMAPSVQEPGLIQPLFIPCPDDWLAMRPVSTVVNNARNETPECLNDPQPAA